jgi:HAMP domain-containing protein
VDTRPWFRIGRQQPYAGPLTEIPDLARELQLADRSEAPKYLELAVPVQGNNGERVGVLGADVQWEWAREVQLSVVPEAARRERIGLTVYAITGDVLLDSGGSGWSRPPDPPELGPRSFRGSLVENAAGGTTYLTGFARSRGHREFRGLGWLVVVRQPVERALAPTRELRHRILGWGMAFTGILATVSWIAAGRLARRLHGIGAAAERIRQGDVLTVMPRPRGESEIAHMCGALGDMVDDFRKKQETLEAEKLRREAESTKHV